MPQGVVKPLIILRKEVVMETALDIDREQKEATQLPEPTGYRILITIPEKEKKTEGGILKAQETLQSEEVSTIVGFVLKMGPDCYKDENRFPTGPWCKQGDFVLFRAFSGTRIKIRGKEFRLLNDDNIEAVVDDPRGIEKI
jgi:co-chaperonin GroES (HSP10)|tara:strand:- start:2161 stop:2583 length:423 start_codon:yes stop_codon:yes gene_type:complete